MQLDNDLAGAIRENRWPERAHDEAIVGGLQERLGLPARDFVLFVRSFPANAIDAALREWNKYREGLIVGTLYCLIDTF